MSLVSSESVSDREGARVGQPPSLTETAERRMASGTIIPDTAHPGTHRERTQSATKGVTGEEGMEIKPSSNEMKWQVVL